MKFLIYFLRPNVTSSLLDTNMLNGTTFSKPAQVKIVESCNVQNKTTNYPVI
jgi:hypothetical protein